MKPLQVVMLLMLAVLVLVASTGGAEARPRYRRACFSSDVRELCCPSACAAKRLSRWQSADQVLRGCEHMLGCVPSSASVSWKCGC